MATSSSTTTQNNIVKTAIGVAFLLATVFAIGWALQKGKKAAE